MHHFMEQFTFYNSVKNIIVNCMSIEDIAHSRNSSLSTACFGGVSARPTIEYLRQSRSKSDYEFARFDLALHCTPIINIRFTKK